MPNSSNTGEDSHIVAPERPLAREAADMLIATVLPVSSHGETAE